MLWKLLRQHISVAQMAGFFFANLCGMVIVLLSVQFYRDVKPVFSSDGDSFVKKDFVILSKKVSTLGTLIGRGSTFSDAEVEDVSRQPFTKSVGRFLPAQFDVSAGMGMNGVNMSTDMFFESVPDEFVDVKSDRWSYDPESGSVPIIIPRNYLNLYNFGFARSRNLPQLTEGIIGMIDLKIRVRGNGKERVLKGVIAGFSNRLNTILVPEAFILDANREFGSGEKPSPSRLIVEVNNPTDDRIARFVQSKGYDTEGNDLDAGRASWFLKVVTGIVLSVGMLISVLSFYILILSIYLLLQKNTKKLENLLLIGFSPARVSLPYQLLTVGLNLAVAVLGIGIMYVVRSGYAETLSGICPGACEGGITVAVGIGLLLFAGVSLLNILIVRRKINGILRI